MLREAGIEVVTGVLEEEARALNPAFMTFQIRKRPYVYLKWAQSADGFIDIRREDASVPSVLLSSAETLRRFIGFVPKWRLLWSGHVRRC